MNQQNKQRTNEQTNERTNEPNVPTRKEFGQAKRMQTDCVEISQGPISGKTFADGKGWGRR